jgi:hypothetical protein
MRYYRRDASDRGVRAATREIRPSACDDTPPTDSIGVASQPIDKKTMPFFHTVIENDLFV